MSHDPRFFEKALVEFEEALFDLKKLLDLHSLLGVSGPMHSAYYDALRNRIDRLGILAKDVPRHLPATDYLMDVDGLKLLVDVRVLVKGLKREDVTPKSLDSIILPLLVNLLRYINSKYFKDLTLAEILYVTEILHTLNREGFEELDPAMVKLNTLHMDWVKHLAETSEEELKVSILFAHDPH